LSWEYLRRQVNQARREIAKRTRCLHCTSYLTSVVGTSKYRVPHSSNDSTFVDCAEVLDVLYDDETLIWINEREMVYKASFAATGTPIYWSYFGGVAQVTGYVQLEPTPNEAKTIRIHAIQLPLPLVYDYSICELNDIIQKIVVNYVEGEIMTKRGHPEGVQLLRMCEKSIYDNMWLKSL
jgi:hypothetical protein